MLVKANLDFESVAKILNLPDPANPGDALNLGYFNNAIAAISGSLTDALTTSSLDCSINPNYPASKVGVKYVVTAAGLIGGSSGVVVNIGDVIFCRADSAAGDHATVGSNFFIVEANRDVATTTLIGLVRFATQQEVLNDSSTLVAVTPSSLKAKLDTLPSIRSFGTLIGNGSSTTFTITHNLDSAYPVVQVYETTNKDMVIADIRVLTNNSVRISFLTAPANNGFYVSVIGVK